MATPTGSTTLTHGALAGRSTKRLTLGTPVLVRLDLDVLRPGEIVDLLPTPDGPRITIRIACCPGDHLCHAVRVDPLGHFLSGPSRENLWCSDAPRGTGIGEWEIR